LTATEILYGIVFQPLATLRYLSSSQPLLMALTAFIVTVLGNMLIKLGINLHQGPGVPLPQGYIGVYLGLGLLFSLLALAAAAAIYNLLGELLYRQANGRGILTCLAFAFVPGILSPPLQYALTLLNLNNFNAAISVLAFLWVVILQVIGIRESLLIQSSQAFFLFILPGFSKAAQSIS
jgi:protein-S-isoprenylcysteine O-methyltransferase Ste14